MAEEAKGQRFSQRAGGFLDKITGSQGAQQTQQTQQQTSGQQSTGGIFLPGISNNQNLINSNKVSMNNGFTQGIQDGTIKSNIVLPGITTKPQTGATFSGLTPKYPNATMTAMTPDEVKEMDKIAKNNGIYKESWNDRIWDEMYKAETIPLLKQGIKQTRDSLKKFGKRMHSDLVESMANVGYVNGAFGAMGSENAQARRDEYINEARESNQKYQDEVNEAFSKRVDKNMNKTLAERYSQTSWRKALKEGDWNNLKYGTKQAFSTSILPMVPGIIAGLVTKNPAVLQGTVFASTLPIEDQEAYEDAMEFGATKEEATAIGHIVGIVNARLESLGDMAQFGGLFKRTIKQGLRREVKRSMKSILLRGVKELAKGTGTESLTEGLQELTKNVLVRAINHDKNILEGVGESAFYGGVLGLGGSSIGAGGQVLNDVQENEKIQAQADIEALKYVAEGEQRKAQRMAREKARARFLEMRKNPTMDNGYTPTPEQAQQRAREKEENEQFEDELRAEQNRENSRYQETEGENSGLSNSNDYSTDTTISKDYSHSDMVNTDSFFKTDENGQYIDFNGGKLYAGETVSDTESQGLKGKYNKSMFSGVESFSRNPIYEEYRQNFYDFLKSLSNRITKKTEKEVKLGKTKTGADMKLTRKQLRHIIKLHGAFSLNDFLETINNPTYSRLQKGGNIYSDGPFYIKQRPNSDKFYYLGFKKNTDGSYNINTFYEITKSDAEGLLNRKLQNSDYQKYQLKYEEEGYTPGVARKDEKNISGKSGKMLKDFLKGQTIEELAKKYGVERIDVVKGLVDGMAYGSYSNRILRLAEEIKESTAPHELLHLVFDMVDPETKTYLISQVMQSEGWSAEKAEEWLADSFSNFYRTGKIESAPKSTWGKIKIFFKRVRSFINGMWKWRNQLEQMFTDIIESSGIEELQGKIDSNKEINKSKAKMRKRFLEYRRNAEKTQAESTRKTPENWEKNVSKKQIADESVYELQPLERIEQMEKLILNEYGTTDNPTRVAFIDNKGRWINGNMGGYGNYRDTDHREIAQTAFDDTDIEFNNATDGLVALQAQTGLVRVNFNDGYMNIDTVYELMPSQKEGLMRFDDEDIKEVYVDITHPQTGKIIESKTFASVRDAVRWIDRHFADSGNKYQKAGDINSPAFKKRFGDWENDPKNASKIVNKDGTPRIVYHGTKADFNVFKNRELGFHFGSTKAQAKVKSGNKGKIMQAYLNIRNPIDVYGDMGIWTANYTFGDRLKEKGIITEDERKSFKYKEDRLSDRILIDILEKKGYDGVIYDNWWEGASEAKSYIAFRPEQIKSATDNVGTYDANNDDIRYQRVYHGSPNEFGNFDSSHMGEGEGNQAHGRGHYVAVDPETARRYAQDKFYRNEIELKGRTMARVDDTRDIPYALRSLYRDIFNTFAMGYYDVEEEAKNVLDRTKKEYEETVEYYEELIRNKTKPSVDMTEEDLKVMQESREKALEEYKEALEFIEDLKPEDIKVREISDRRNFYEVEIPDPVKADTPTGSNYLEEGATLKKSEINKLKKAYKEIKGEELDMLSSYRDKHIDGVDVYRSLEQALNSNKEASKFLEAIGYNGIHYYGGVDGEAYVIFNDNDLEIKNHEKYQKVEYEYDEEGNRKWIKFEEDNGEFDPSIFGEPTREEQIADDKENEKNNPFYNAWIRYNNQNYKDDQLTFEEFIQGISERGDKEQAEYNKKLSDISEAQNDPQLLDLQLRAVKLMEEEGNVGKKFGKNVSKEVRDRQQKEVESKREQLISDIVDYMYPGLKTEEITYDMQKEADQKEAEREMMGREDIENKLKYFKKDKNGNREAKEIKIENPQIKLDKILSAGKFEEIFTPLDRVIEWRTPQGQHGVIDNQKNPKKYKSVMEKINAGKTKTKVTLKDVTRDYRALEKVRAEQEAEKERRKRERQEEFAKKKQEEYKKIVRMKAFQRLVDMQRFEKYPFLTEEEIKNRYGFTDEEWKKITEQEEIKLPKKRGEKAISDFNKAVFDQVKVIRDGLERQNRMKQKDAEKNLGEIGEIDVDILLGRDEEKGQKEVEEFEKIAEEEKKKSKKEKNKRMKEAVEEVLNIDIDTKREQQEKEKIEKMLKKVKNDETGKSKLWRELKTAFSTVDHKIKNISKPIYQALMQYFQNTSILTNERLKEATPFINALKKIRKENPVRYMDIRVALANRNIGYANGLLQEYGVKVPTKLLDTIYDEAEDVGLNINYLGSYYPLKVRSPKSLLTEIMGMKEGDFASEIDKRIKEESEKNGGPLDESQISDIIAEVIAGEDKGPDVRLGNAHMKKRNEKIKRTPKMLEYCYDPATTLIGYIEGMTQSIERAKFLGKSASGQVRDLSTYVYKVKHDLTWEQQDELMYLLQAVFNDKQQGFLFNTWRDIATLTTLGSPTSTLTQIGDLGFSIYENGLGNTWKALWNMGIKKGLFNLEDMGIINRGEEFTNINEKKTRFQKGINLVFKITGFSKMDMFGKSMYIKSTRLKRQKRAKKGENGDPQLRKDIMKRTDDEYVTDKIISDIRHGIFSKEISMIMFMKLSNFQPLTRAQMPEAYLDHPWYIRMLYQFKTFGLKQTNYIISECKESLKEAKNGTPQQKREAVGRIVSLVASLALMGLGADELKDLLMRRRNESMILRAIFGDGNIDDKFVDKFVDNLAKLSGLSRYAIMNIKNDPVGIITSLFTDMPGENVINYPYRDIKNWLNGKSSDQMTQLFPVVGKRYYWAIGGGHDKQMEKLNKSKGGTNTSDSSRKTSNSSRRKNSSSSKKSNASRRKK